MDKQKRICFILDWYPTPNNNGCQFVKTLIYSMANKGIGCDVIVPVILGSRNDVPYHRKEVTSNGAEINIYMPTYLHLSSRKYMMKYSMNNHYHAALGVIVREGLQPDYVYGHFIYQCGLTAVRIGKKLNIPSYCACGENSTRLSEDGTIYKNGLNHAKWRKILSDLTGMICVSSNNKNLLERGEYLSPTCKVDVFPNGIDKTIFFPMDKRSVRRQLRLPEEAFIVAFTGAFSERKGYKILCEALKKCEGINSVFMGKGEEDTELKGVLFSGHVENSQVPMYLNAADIFVLPTVGEGCCNAIIEALACGIPVVSSDLPFNDDILDSTNSIRVDVSNVDAVVKAISDLQRDSDLRKILAEGARISSHKLDINERASRIWRFMEEN